MFDETWMRIIKVSRVSVHFPGKGNGPGFSLTGRPSALDRSLLERARRIFCMHVCRSFLNTFFPVRAVAQGSLCVVGRWPSTAPCHFGHVGFVVCMFTCFSEEHFYRVC